MSVPVLQERAPFDAAATTATGSGTAARGSLGTPHCHTPYDARIDAPQAGIFALGTASHAYLELELVDGREGRDLVGAAASLREPRTTMGGVNLVAGFRPELWRNLVPEDMPHGLEGFNHDVLGRDGYTRSMKPSHVNRRNPLQTASKSTDGRTTPMATDESLRAPLFRIAKNPLS